jgi:mannose-6-phosphate isomerase-like protein (cupin superfamily)
VSYTVVTANAVAAGPGPHPAASPFDKRISKRLGVTAFEVYQVELPAHAETVLHDHLADDVEDMYAVVGGTGWVVVDDEQLPVGPGYFVAVTVESRRQVRAGDRGLHFIAVCAPRHH